MSTRKEEREEEERALALQEKIIAFAAAYYRIDTVEIKTKTRRVRIVEPRQIAAYLLQDIMGLSFPYIGSIFGLHHSTAVYAYQKI